MWLSVPAHADFNPSPLQHVQVNGATIGYRTAGSGPPLVMIMGFGATMAEWDPALIADLATQHTVVLFDNRGIATSLPSPVRGLTIARMADDTAALTDALGFGKADGRHASARPRSSPTARSTSSSRRRTRA